MEDEPALCSTCGLLIAMKDRAECLYCILKVRGLPPSDEAPGIGDS